MIHPGIKLAKWLEAKNISERDFSEASNIPKSTLRDILRGRRGIGFDTADKLEAVIPEMSADMWTYSQYRYNRFIHRKEHE